MSKSSFKVVVGPVLVLPDTVARVVEFPDGSGRIETWDSATCSWWIGEADAFDVLTAGCSLSPEELAVRGVVC